MADRPLGRAPEDPGRRPEVAAARPAAGRPPARPSAARRPRRRAAALDLHGLQGHGPRGESDLRRPGQGIGHRRAQAVRRARRGPRCRGPHARGPGGGPGHAARGRGPGRVAARGAARPPPGTVPPRAAGRLRRPGLRRQRRGRASATLPARVRADVLPSGRHPVQGPQGSRPRSGRRAGDARPRPRRGAGTLTADQRRSARM